MMKLLGSPLSPYVRKALITAELKGLAGRIELIPADTNKGDETLFQKNPLGKIPCLLTEDGQSIFDSHVVCEYLDSLAPSPVLFPRSGPERWRTLTLGALGDGILDAALLLVYETRFRPEGMAVQGWIDRQQAKIDRSVDLLEKSPPAMGSAPDYGHVTVAAALGYLDFRHHGRWRQAHPKMVAWLDTFSRSVPAFEKTRPAG
jgi:glutathione S-transferase